MTSEAGALRRAFSTSRVLVTGAFGFLGSHTVRRLVDAGARVTALDIRTAASRPCLLNEPSLGLRPRIAVETADMTSFETVRGVAARGRFDFVFHFAAYATVIEKALARPFETIEANAMAWVNLLEALRRLRRRPAAVLFASTDKVYGDAGGAAYDEERTPLRGIGVYDSAKLAADLFARVYHEAYGLPTITLRMCNVFGPYDFNTGFRLVPKTLEGLYGRSPMRAPELYPGSAAHRRDYLYVDDAVRAALLLAREPRCRGEVFNLMACRNLSTPEMLRALLGTAVRVERAFDPGRARALAALRPRRVARRPAGGRLVAIGRQHLRSRKLREAVGFRPAVTFDDALERTVRFYRDWFLGGGRRP